mmetsp:Transcript_21852/g.32562  ORF Transcript_21852/g.32562 Transcript_21852/m.32562 type:complete len:406 (-) Transcript_21852:139-1356(-)
MATWSGVHEHSLLRSPYESIHMVTRNTQKIVAKEISDVVTDMRRLSKAVKEKGKGANLINATKSITSTIGKLKGLKRKMEEGEKTAKKYINRCKSRLAHLDKKYAPNEKNQNAFTRSIDAMIVEHLMREGCLQSAIFMAKSSNIIDLVDYEVFHSAQKVIQGLRNHNCKPALTWCGANRSRLRRSQSSLELDLHIQQFVELLRKNEVNEAISYARSHLSKAQGTCLETLFHAMGAIAFFPRSEKCGEFPQRYRYLFEEKNWEKLEASFREVLLKLNGLSKESTLSLRLQGGLEALKTPSCDEAGNNESKEESKLDKSLSECPVCAPGMYSLAKDLPPSHRTQSCIVCRITGKVMDEHNPPIALPNGNVYSKKGLLESGENKGGKILDPRTGEKFNSGDSKNVFIL